VESSRERGAIARSARDAVATARQQQVGQAGAVKAGSKELGARRKNLIQAFLLHAPCSMLHAPRSVLLAFMLVDETRRGPFSAACDRRACKSVSWQCWRGRAFLEPGGGRHRRLAGGLRMCGAASGDSGRCCSRRVWHIV